MLQLLADGLSSEDIALTLNCPERKVKHVIHRSCTRLSLGHRTWAAARAAWR
ncbi:LuxR C-terminal-related transcriptional regulator [Streptomyces sp. NPDC051572]|uniref:LuxR C-terminal-related transcriptional regulator n=1 Tax=unclassified Streptomyces TaxID=2593676 RepID=UPI00344D1446